MARFTLTSKHGVMHLNCTRAHAEHTAQALADKTHAGVNLEAHAASPKRRKKASAKKRTTKKRRTRKRAARKTTARKRAPKRTRRARKTSARKTRRTRRTARRGKKR
jgi:chromatin remodeling complex protein RSC6